MRYLLPVQAPSSLLEGTTWGGSWGTSLGHFLGTLLGSTWWLFLGARLWALPWGSSWGHSLWVKIGLYCGLKSVCRFDETIWFFRHLWHQYFPRAFSKTLIYASTIYFKGCTKVGNHDLSPVKAKWQSIDFIKLFRICINYDLQNVEEFWRTCHLMKV